ncbi:hypothetical protein, partial [Bifidobacterium moukalabense]|uniref:hypothetical protein n=1 Tax=Bifidobacterium moukalabense TaxID=1333651 RepID=UPI001BB14CDD
MRREKHHRTGTGPGKTKRAAAADVRAPVRHVPRHSPTHDTYNRIDAGSRAGLVEMNRSSCHGRARPKGRNLSGAAKNRSRYRGHQADGPYYPILILNIEFEILRLYEKGDP